MMAHQHKRRWSIHEGRFELLLELYENGISYMNQDEETWVCHNNLREKAHGNVLIAGLGIGMVNRMIDGKVNMITTIERASEVIKLCSQYVNPKKNNIINADFEEWIKTATDKYDIIWIDMDKSYTLDEQIDYKKRCRHLLKEGGEILFWKRRGEA